MALLRQLAIRIDGRRRLIAVVLIGWVALAATGAGQKADTSGAFALPDLRDVFVVVLGILALCGLVLLPLMFGKQEHQFEPKPIRRIRWLMLVTAIIVLLAFAVGPQDFQLESEEEAPVSVVIAEPLEEPAPVVAADNGDALIVLFLACVSAGAFLMWSRRRLASVLGDVDESEPSLESEVGPAIDAATDRLLRGDDPRMSVLAAYAGLERSLAEQGRGRNPHETPSEHLARVLASLPVVLGPAIRLGELYELARFSDHAITSDDQRRAAVALDQSRNMLAEQLSTTP
jgi:MFS family permease